MSCCSCCCGGAGLALPVVPLLEICGAVWVVEHLIAVLIVCAVCGLLAVLASVLLLRWAQRRDDARMVAWRARHAQLGRPVTTVRAEVVEPSRQQTALPTGSLAPGIGNGITSLGRPALGSPPKSWLCETCYWAWPLDVRFCGICGGSRAAHGAEREVVIRQALGRNQP